MQNSNLARWIDNVEDYVGFNWSRRFAERVFLTRSHWFGPRVTNKDNLLCYGASHGYEEVVRTALRNGADPNTRCWNGDTPMMCALESYASYLVPLLIESGGDVNARNDDGQTPLIYAYNAPTEVVALLIQKGADVNAEDDTGETPLSMARRFGHANVQLLREAGAREADQPE